MKMINDYDVISDIYDVYNTADYDIDFYLERYISFQGRAAELMAGTGRLSIPLLRNGIKLDCVDISKGLLDRLTDKLSELQISADVYCQDIRELHLNGLYDLVIIGFNSLSEIVDYDDRRRVFNSVKNLLTDSGEFIFTLYNPAYRRKLINSDLSLVNEHNIREDKMLFFMSSFEENEIVNVFQLYELYDKKNNLKSKRILNLKFKLIERVEIERHISEYGFAIKEFYGDFDGSEFNDEVSPFMIYILKK